MIRDLVLLAVHALWLWTATGMVVSGLIGGLAASWKRVPVLPAVAVSAFIPGLGVLGVLLWARWRHGPASPWAAIPWAAIPRLGIARLGIARLGIARLGIARLGIARLGIARSAIGRLGSRSLGRTPVAVTDPPVPGNPWSAHSTGPIRSAQPPAARGPESGRRWVRDTGTRRPGRLPAALVVTGACLPAALLCLALPYSWFSVRPVDVVFGGYFGASSVVTAVPLLACSALLAASGFLQAARPSRLWSLVAVLCSAPWIAVGGQILLAAEDLSRITERLARGARSPAQVDVVAAHGAYLMLAAGLLGLAWACSTAVRIHRLAGPDVPGGILDG